MKTNSLHRLSTFPLRALRRSVPRWQSLCRRSATRRTATVRSCFDAMTKVMTTPHHTFMTETAAFHGSDEPISAESISAGGVNYIKVNGKWIGSSYTSQEMLKQSDENRKSVRSDDCHHFRDEVVSGEATSVYSAHSEQRTPNRRPDLDIQEQWPAAARRTRHGHRRDDRQESPLDAVRVWERQAPNVNCGRDREQTGLRKD
jgi:hypothetical protein